MPILLGNHTPIYTYTYIHTYVHTHTHKHKTPQHTQQIADELKKERAAEEIRAITPAQKTARDKQAWTAWLRRYRARLDAEAAAGATSDARRTIMLSTNPRYILRQWVAEWAIREADKGNYQGVQAVLAVLQQPFSEKSTAELIRGAVQIPPGGDGMNQGADGGGGGEGGVCVMVPELDGRVPDWGRKLCVSCSS